MKENKASLTAFYTVFPDILKGEKLSLNSLPNLSLQKQEDLENETYRLMFYDLIPQMCVVIISTYSSNIYIFILPFSPNYFLNFFFKIINIGKNLLTIM